MASRPTSSAVTASTPPASAARPGQPCVRPAPRLSVSGLGTQPGAGAVPRRHADGIQLGTDPPRALEVVLHRGAVLHGLPLLLAHPPTGACPPGTRLAPELVDLVEGDLGGQPGGVVRGGQPIPGRPRARVA